MTDDTMRRFEEIARKALKCDACFQDLKVTPADVDLAQPRLVGEDYWKAEPKILFLLVNPGSGAGYNDEANNRLRSLLRSYRDGAIELEKVFDHQRDDMPKWGHGSFVRFYIEGLGVRLEDVAFANLAWCATQKNCYPMQMLRRCFGRHTSALLELLDPDVVVVSGSRAHALSKDVEKTLPKATVIKTLHYAHRKGKAAEYQELKRIRATLASLDKTSDRLRACGRGEQDGTE